MPRLGAFRGFLLLWLACAASAAHVKDVPDLPKDGSLEQEPVVKTQGAPAGCNKRSGLGDMVLLQVHGQEVTSGQKVHIKGMDEGEPLVLRIGRKRHGEVWDTAGDAACVGEKRTIFLPERNAKAKAKASPAVVWDVKVLRITKQNDPAAGMVELWDKAETSGDQRLSPEEIVGFLDTAPKVWEGMPNRKDDPEKYKREKIGFVRNLLKRDSNHDRVLSWGELSHPNHDGSSHDGEL